MGAAKMHDGQIETTNGLMRRLLESQFPPVSGRAGPGRPAADRRLGGRPGRQRPALVAGSGTPPDAAGPRSRGRGTARGGLSVAVAGGPVDRGGDPGPGQPRSGPGGRLPGPVCRLTARNPSGWRAGEVRHFAGRTPGEPGSGDPASHRGVARRHRQSGGDPRVGGGTVGPSLAAGSGVDPWRPRSRKPDRASAQFGSGHRLQRPGTR